MQLPQTLVEARELAYHNVPSAAMNRSLRDAGAGGRAALRSQSSALVDDLEGLGRKVRGSISISPQMGLPFKTRLRLVGAEASRLQGELNQIVAKIDAIDKLESGVDDIPDLERGGAPVVGLPPLAALIPFIWPAVVVIVSLGGIGLWTSDGAVEAEKEKDVLLTQTEAILARYDACVGSGKSSVECEAILKHLPKWARSSVLPWVLGIAGVGVVGFLVWKNSAPKEAS